MNNDDTKPAVAPRVRSGMGAVPEDAPCRPCPDHFPALPNPAAFYGIAGEIVSMIAPETEAQPVAILLHLLIAVGNIVGRRVWSVAGGVRHHLNLFAVVVGDTSRARKGTSWAAVQPIVGGGDYSDGLDPGWRERRVKSGLSSGEGLKWFVRDPITKPGDEQPADLGETDKRLFVIEEEFANVLQMGKREGNTLSTVLRHAWDGKRLETLTKNDPVTATGAHVSIVGHITREELRALLTRADTFNGFSNRFLWLASQRTRLLPDGGRLDRLNFAPLRDRLNAARSSIQGELRRDDAAGKLWAEFYTRSANTNLLGVLGVVTNRAEPQVMRLSALYALLDGASEVRAAHLSAALALWDYCERSARWIFGDSTGNADAEAIHAALIRRGTAGMSQTEISRDVFHGNRKTEQITAALDVLRAAGMAQPFEVRDTGGAPARYWYAGQVPNEINEINELRPDRSGFISLNSSDSYRSENGNEARP